MIAKQNLIHAHQSFLIEFGKSTHFCLAPRIFVEILRNSVLCVNLSSGYNVEQVYKSCVCFPERDFPSLHTLAHQALLIKVPVPLHLRSLYDLYIARAGFHNADMFQCK